MRALAIALLLAACGPGVRPDDMSAERHRQEAERERAIARQHLDAYHPEAVRGAIVPLRDETGTPTFYPLVFYNPTSWHLDEATAHSDHARQHEAAAATLERFEIEECKDFPPESRVACPILGGVRELRFLPRGVEVVFGDGVPVDAVLAHMRCHLAYARVRGFDQAISCPLYMKGIRIEPAAGRGAIDIIGDDEVIAREVQRRAKEEVRADRRAPRI